MTKRILYLEDLYDFYANHKNSSHYSVDEKHRPIVVQTKGCITFADDEDGSKDGLLAVHLQACHTDLNRNASNINEDVMSSALESFKNRPILGYIHDVDGQPCFYTHNMHEENGELIYDEFPIGIIPESCKAELVYDDEKKRKYVEVDGYIFEEYSKAAEIMRREKKLDCSVELSIRSLSYNAKQKYLDIEDFFFSGVTILQCDEDGNEVRPGMEGANIRLADFSEDNNSLFAKKLDSLQEKVDELLSRFDIENYSKEGGEIVSKFEELLEKYGKTLEDIDFEYSDMSDEELEAKFEEVFETLNNDSEEQPEVEFDEKTDDEPTSEEDGESEDEENEEELEENSDEETLSDTNACGGGSGTKRKVKKNSEDNTEEVSFELSHEDIRFALYNLLCAFEEADNTCYWISNVFDDKFIYETWDGERCFGQSYATEDDNVVFVGERYELFKELLTESEKARIEEMRSNYEALVEFKSEIEKNAAHQEREAILLDEKYSVISVRNEDGGFANDSFGALYSDMDNYSCEELEEKLKVIIGEYALSGGAIEPNKHEHNTELKVFANLNSKNVKKPSKYGTLKFSK